MSFIYLFNKNLTILRSLLVLVGSFSFCSYLRPCNERYHQKIFSNYLRGWKFGLYVNQTFILFPLLTVLLALAYFSSLHVYCMFLCRKASESVSQKISHKLVKGIGHRRIDEPGELPSPFPIIKRLFQATTTTCE